MSATASELRQLLHECPELSTWQIWNITLLQDDLDPAATLELVLVLSARADARQDVDIRLARRLVSVKTSLEDHIEATARRTRELNELRKECSAFFDGERRADPPTARCLSTVQRLNTCTLRRDPAGHRLLSDALEGLLLGASQSLRVQVTFLRAQLHHCRDEYDEAVRDYDAVVRQTTTEPIREMALGALIELLERHGRRATLDELADRMVEDEDFSRMSDSTRTRLANSKASNIYERTDGKFEACARELDAFLKAFPDADGATSDALYNSGNCHYRRGDRATAIERWRALQRRDPDHPALERVRGLGVELE